MVLYLLLPVIGAAVFLAVRIKRPEPGSRLAPVTGSVSDVMLAAGTALCQAGHSVKWAAPGDDAAVPGTVAGTCRRCGGGLLIADETGEVSIRPWLPLGTSRGFRRCPGTKKEGGQAAPER